MLEAETWQTHRCTEKGASVGILEKSNPIKAAAIQEGIGTADTIPCTSMIYIFFKYIQYKYIYIYIERERHVYQYRLLAKIIDYEQHNQLSL